MNKNEIQLYYCPFNKGSGKNNFNKANVVHVVDNEALTSLVKIMKSCRYVYYNLKSVLNTPKEATVTQPDFLGTLCGLFIYPP